MNPLATFLLLANGTLLLFLPRRWAPLPLLAGACYLTLGQGIQLGSFSLPCIRILMAIGIARVILRGERLAGGVIGLDRLMLVWGVWAVSSSWFHKDFPAAIEFRLGMAYNALGIYFLLRIFCQSKTDILALCRITAIVLLPVAFEMVLEKLTSHNVFSVFGGVPDNPVTREGKLRAQGPFAHPILAGTVGAACLPLMIALWWRNRIESVSGCLACLTMVLTSGSSGPIMSAIAGLGALFLWTQRSKMRIIQVLTILTYILLELIMTAPAYYLMARIDLAGGSTGWHRARLIESSLAHLPEWWFAGTDYTRHWMPTGVSWDPDHTDITNYYLKMGVIGGLPLLLLFVAVVMKAFTLIGQSIRVPLDLEYEDRFIFWSVGASLFAHAATSISVSYFDQSFVFLYLSLGAAASGWATVLSKNSQQESSLRQKHDYANHREGTSYGATAATA